MLSYITKYIRKSKGVFAFTILAFFTISFIVPLALSAVYTSRALVNQDISKYSRGEYDLLIRSENSISKVEKTLGLVEENYLSSGYGGISIEQYNKIKAMEGVEIAAPIATIGYFTSAHNSITVSFPQEKSYHIKTKVYTYDGNKDYLIDSQDYYQIGTNKILDGIKDHPVNFFPLSVQIFSDERGKIEYPIVLPQIWDMLVAVDFEQENKLINMGKYITSGNLITNGQVYEKATHGLKERVIPIIINENAYVPMKITLDFEEYNLSREQGSKIIEGIVDSSKLESAYMLDDKIKDKLKTILEGNIKSKSTNMSGLLKPFTTTILNLKEDGQNIEEVNAGASFVTSQGSLYYKASPVIYEVDYEDIKAVPQNEKNGILIFREMEEVGSKLKETIKNHEIINTFEVCGSIKMPEACEEKLTGSPLGIYGDNYVALYEENKDKSDLKRIFPTVEPGSFVPSAPRGYTSLEAYEYLKVNEPIDAIRVRVAGIEKYDDESKERIERLASKINEETGLHVDVVAGSSTKEIIVSLKGLNETGILGRVIERWTTLGTAASIVKSWSTMGGILTFLFMLCGLLFIINRVSCSILNRQGEIGILKSIGWENKHICKMIALENAIEALISVFLSLISIVILNKFFEIKYIYSIFAAHSVLFLFITPTASYLYSYKIEKRASMVKTKLNDLSLKRPFENTSINKMVINNIAAYIKRSLLIVMQISLAGGLGVYTFLSIKAAKNYISATALGKRVNTTTSPMISILIIGSMLMLVFTVADRFTTIIMERKNYIGTLRALGWKKWHIIRLVIGEVLVLSIAGTAISALLSLTGFNIMYKEFPITLAMLLLVFSTIIILALLSGFYPLYRAFEITPIDAVVRLDTWSRYKKRKV